MAISQLAQDDVQLSLLATTGPAGLAVDVLTARFGLSADYAESVVDQGYGLLIARLEAMTKPKAAEDAFAAEAAEEEPRAAMIAAPRLATVGMKSFSSEGSYPPPLLLSTAVKDSQNGELDPRERSSNATPGDVLAARATSCSIPSVFLPIPRGGVLMTRASATWSLGLWTSRK